VNVTSGAGGAESAKEAEVPLPENNPVGPKVPLNRFWFARFKIEKVPDQDCSKMLPDPSTVAGVLDVAEKFSLAVIMPAGKPSPPAQKNPIGISTPETSDSDVPPTLVSA